MQINKQLEQARERLLDLTLRNRLLNFRPSNRRSIRIVDEIPREIFEILVLKERIMDFKAYAEPVEGTIESTKEQIRYPTNTDLFQVRENLLKILNYVVTHPELLVESIQEITPTENKSIDNTPLIETDDSDLLTWLQDVQKNEDIPLSQSEAKDAYEYRRKNNQKLLEQTHQETKFNKSHTDRFLQTTLSQDELQKRLYYINQQSRSVFEEQGYSVLYLALGFLKWQDSENKEKINSAPLILIPIELERQKDRTKFRLKWSGSDLMPNLSLEAKLSEQGISLPTLETFEDKSDIDDFFQNVINAISPRSDWEVVDDIYLDMFSFTKFVMYKDLDPQEWDFKRHPLLELVLSGMDTEEHHNITGHEQTPIKQPSEGVYHVMDADSSQIAVIEAVKAGDNLVVEGPPGTGKSQTITNLIAELLAAGKKVLFVSEKMAALEVVKSRLDKVGLGNYCIELHSHKSNKKEVLQELERSLNTRFNHAKSGSDQYTQLDSLKDILNGYVKTLHTPIAKIEKSPSELFSIREKTREYFAEKELNMPRVWFSDPSSGDKDSWNNAINSLENLSPMLHRVAPISDHPWKGCALGTISIQNEEEIFQVISDFAASLDDLLGVFSDIEHKLGVRMPKSFEYYARHFEAVELIENTFSVDASVLLNTKWDSFNNEAKELIQQVEIIAQAKEKFTRYALDTDPVLKLDTSYIMKLADEYEDFSYQPKWRRLISWKYIRNVKKPIRSFYRSTMPKDPVKVREDLKELSECIDMREQMEWIMAATETGPALFGNQWDGEDSQPEKLREFADWIVKFRGCLRDGTLTEMTVDIVSKANSDIIFDAIRDDLDSAVKNFRMKRHLLFETLNTSSEDLFGIEEDNVFFQDYIDRIDLWKQERSLLRTWSQFSSRLLACRETIAEPILKCIDKLNPNDLVPCFEGNFSESLLEEIFRTNSYIGDFWGEQHNKKITEFKHLDSVCMELNQRRLMSELDEKKPNFYGGASSESEMGILQGQFNRKRGHMSIRKLLSVTGNLLQRIKPCFMMSPLSVAQFCDPKIMQFDVIVFDEASQIRPEDALGALLRAKQAVVIGDTRQLPPTRFFDSIVEGSDEDTDDETVSIIDVESILHQCRQRFVVNQLKWHYRSRHESLITISNQEFYQNELLIFPSPIDKAENLGLKFVHIPHAIYDRGNTSTNQIEAEVVVEAVFDHFRKNPDKSLGVGTFNMRQQQLILDEVERKLTQYPEMSEVFSRNKYEHFFVKNLETIQGDERDCIFLSVGYGKDIKGRLYKNFGPLNHDGGERRLNVLITRAREKCVVFSNFRAGDLQLDSSAAFGLRALKSFLDYAEKRSSVFQSPEIGMTGSDIEDEVHEFLSDHGFIVKRGIGCDEYRIDLAIVDPQDTNCYLIGIECDGEQYKNALTARDRDRLRTQVLKGLGWNLHRVWSMDWYQRRDETKNLILDAIQNADSKKDNQTNNIESAKPFELSQSEIEIEIETENSSTQETTPQFHDYIECKTLGIPNTGELHHQSPTLLAEAIQQVVIVESPVHINLVVLRIRTLWGLAKAGAKIRNAIENGVLYAERNDMVRRKGNYLWTNDDGEVTVRKRKSPDIEWICDEEIIEAMKSVLSLQGAITPDALISESAKYFGYKSKGRRIVERISSIIDELVEHRIFSINQQNMVNLIDQEQEVK